MELLVTMDLNMEKKHHRIPNVKIEQRLQDLRDTKKTYDAMAADQLKKGDQLIYWYWR